VRSSTLGGIFSRLYRNAWKYFNETCHNYSLPGPHDTDDMCKFIISEVKVKVTGTDNIFQIFTVWERSPIEKI